MDSVPAGLFCFWKEAMTKNQERQYEEPEVLREILERTLAGKNFRLDCHHVSFGHFLGNDIAICNGTEFKVVCSQCGY